MVIIKEVPATITASSSSSSKGITKGFLSGDARLYGDEGSPEGAVTEEQRRRRDEYELTCKSNDAMHEVLHKRDRIVDGYDGKYPDKAPWYTPEYPKNCEYNNPQCVMDPLQCSQSTEAHQRLLVHSKRWQDILDGTSGLVEVRLSYSGIRDSDIDVVMDVLEERHNNTCTFIDLSSNDIMDAGVQALVGRLCDKKVLPALNKLWLFGNKFTDLGESGGCCSHYEDSVDGALRVRAVESRMAAASGEEEDPLPSRKRQRLAANPDDHPSSSSSSSSSGLSPVKIEDGSGPHHREEEPAQDPATSSSSASSVPAAAPAAPPPQPEAAVVDILDSSEDEGPVDVLEVSSDSDDDEDDDELEAVVEDPIEVDLLDDEDFEAGAAPIAITEDEASEGGHHSDTDHNDAEDDDDVEFVGETRAAGANWGLRWQHRNRLDNSALRALDRHLGFNPPVGIQDVFGAPPPPVAHPLPNAFINRANRERLRAGGVRRYNGGNLPDLRDLDTPQPGEGDRPLYAVRYPRGNRQRCEVCRRNISLNSTALCYRSRLMVKTVHVECAPNSRAMYRPADVGIDVIFQDAVANDEAEVDRVISTLSHLRSRRLMDREGELQRRRNNRRQNGGDLLLDMRIPPQQQQPQPVMEDPGRVLGFDNGLHEGLLAYNWLLPGAAAVAGFGPPGHHINMYHSSVAEALLRGRMPQRGPPPPSIPAMLKKCTRVVIKKGDVDPDTNDFRECTICLEPMKTRQAVIELPCEHRYHRGCIEKWFKTASTKDPTNVRCPLDKKSLFEMLGEPVPG
ncbi:hypothetical protein FOZ62_024807 [Perkinsus olseni]|uniref:RING-type domain-containing protein n=1 Tax=Perkinsus olseni TaxID=32597 RepID=A0A7J6QW25_PEROL|nr:hypothetical protein FOZ62_024807 [Perkinsus olseni]